MMGAAEGAMGHQRVAGLRQPRHGVDLRGLEGLLPGHIRQDGGQPPGQHGLAGAGGAHQQHIVSAGGGDLQRTLHVLLSHDLGEVRHGQRLAGGLPPLRRRDERLAPEMRQQLGDIFHRIHGDTVGQRGLGGVPGRDIELADAAPGGAQGHGQHPRHRAQGAGEAQLPQKGGVLRQGRQLLRGRQQPQQDGQIVDRPLLPLVRRSQIHRNAADGEPGAAGLDRRPDPLTGFPHGGIRQAHHVEGREPSRQEALHRHLISADARQAQRAHRHHHCSVTLSRKFRSFLLILSQFSPAGNPLSLSGGKISGKMSEPP